LKPKVISFYFEDKNSWKKQINNNENKITNNIKNDEKNITNLQNEDKEISLI